jgi:hypothetical protein
MRFYQILLLSVCVALGSLCSACRSTRANLSFTPAMAQTFSLMINTYTHKENS